MKSPRRKNINDQIYLKNIIVKTVKDLNIRDLGPMKKLGEGGYGKVFITKNYKTGKDIVIKLIDRNNEDARIFDDETEILEYLKSECDKYIICYLGKYIDKNFYYIITENDQEYISLDEYIKKNKRIDKNKIKIIINNLIRGLKKIHMLGIAHRDIKPYNIVINPYTLDIKYIDFGLSCLKYTCKLPYIVGTPLYKAPELSSYYKNSLSNNRKTDIWSLGLTIFELIYGTNYFLVLDESEELDEDVIEIFYQYLYEKNIKSLPINKFIKDPKYNILLNNMLQLNPSKRKLLLLR